jgi:hypothetical protein
MSGGLRLTLPSNCQRSFYQSGGIVSVASTTVLILISLPVALKAGPVQDIVFVVLITEIVVDRIMDLSSEVTGRATNPCMLTAGSGVGGKVISSDPAESWTQPAVTRTEPIRTSRITGHTIPAGKRQHTIGQSWLLAYIKIMILWDGLRQFSFFLCQSLWNSVGMQRSKSSRL